MVTNSFYSLPKCRGGLRYYSYTFLDVAAYVDMCHGRRSRCVKFMCKTLHKVHFTGCWRGSSSTLLKHKAYDEPWRCSGEQRGAPAAQDQAIALREGRRFSYAPTQYIVVEIGAAWLDIREHTCFFFSPTKDWNVWFRNYFHPKYLHGWWVFFMSDVFFNISIWV